MSTTVQIIGGNFQDSEGNLLEDGFLIFELNQDAQVNGDSEICGGSRIRIPLDENGDVLADPEQFMWPNDVMLPSNTYYMVSAYTSEGQLVWGPNAQQVLSDPSPFDIGAWIPQDTNTQYNPPIVNNTSWAEVPAGTIDGTNTVFTLLKPPSPKASLVLYLNGVFQTQGIDYTLSGNVITYTSAPLSEPPPGDTHVSFYQYLS